MVVQHGAAQVVGRGDGVHVPCEVEVDVLHGQNLGIAAAGRPALDAEHRPQRGLPQGNDGVFADLLHGLSQTCGSGGFPLTGWGGIDCCHQHQLAVGLICQTDKGPFVDLGFIFPVELQLVLLDTQLCRDLRNGSERCALGDLNVRKHASPHLSGRCTAKNRFFRSFTL